VTAVALATVTAALRAAGLLRETRGTQPETITGIADDSRAVARGGMFVAVRGSSQDGHAYLGTAAAAGAAVAIVEDPAQATIPAIVVHDGRRAAAVAAAAYYGEPQRALTAVAVTGTNGKTTTVGMIRHLLHSDAAPAASIGTLGVLTGSAGTPVPGGAGLTTPGPVELQRVLRLLVDAGVRTVALEASSHALDQRRLDGVQFAAAVFTNLTRDHLDYHHSMDAYFGAKARLVSLLAPDGALVVNADDRAWDALPAVANRVTFGAAPDATVRAASPRFTMRGSDWTLRASNHTYPVHLPLVGDFNVINALGAAATAIALGHQPAIVAARLTSLPQVPGRLERLSDSPLVLRDYAHTPDALERAILAVAPFVDRGRVIVVFGCGGDRDAGKRPLMGGVAERLAGHVILTSDNPRTEDPERILDDIERGMARTTHERIEDRRAAIARALEIADRQHDIVLLAGKGHETYQIRGTERLPFDEAVIVRELLGDQP
jgi:UDP-N-acetylmuramoyl-L-alanyl-D-glutamate--2,6-diaminopimelate ligase